jgi:integrase
MAKGASTLVPLSFEGNCVNKYLDAMSNLRENTYNSTKTRLSLFPKYVEDIHSCSVDDLIAGIKRGKYERYDVLARYATYAKKAKKSDARIRNLVKQARAMLEYNDIEFSDRMFRTKVRLPRLIRRLKKPLTKNQIADILLAASGIELKTVLMMLAATGMRPIEAFSIRHRDLDLESSPPRVYIRGEFAKTGTERYSFLTSELVKQLKTYLNFKFRERKITYDDAELGHKKQIVVKGELRPEDLLFGIYHRDSKYVDTKPKSLYILYVTDFNALLDSMGKGERVNPSYTKSWRQISFYSFRRYAKTAISNAGYGDFAEWQIGHSGSPYWAESDEKKAELFGRVEPFLTFLDIGAMESRGADMQTKVEQVQEENTELRKSLKLMFAAIAAQDEKSKADALRKLAADGWLEPELKG